MPLCIPKEYFGKEGFEDIFLIRDSLAREKKLGEFFDLKTAKDINNRFEKIKLLKKSEVGVEKLIKDIKGMNEEKKATFLEKMKIENERKSALLEDLQLSGEIKSKEMMDIEKIANDIYNKKYDLGITPEESKKIMELTNVADETSKLPKQMNGDLSLEAATAKYELLEAIGEIKSKTPQVTSKNGKMVKENLFFGKDSKMARETANMSKMEKVAYFLDQNRKYISSGTFKSMKATWDFSSSTIQGIRIFLTSPKKYVKAQKEAFKVFGGKEYMKAWRINQLSKKYHDQAIESGLRLGTEEQLLKPGKSNRFDDYFTVSIQDARYGIYETSVDSLEKRFERKLDITDSNYEQLVSKAKEDYKIKHGVSNEIAEQKFVKPVRDSKLLKEIAADANKITGTTNLGKLEVLSPALNEGFFAARYGLSDVRMYTDVLDPTISKIGRIRAIKRLGQSMGYMMAGYYALSKAFPDDTETDPTAANFMRFHIGDKWYGIKMPGEWLFKLGAKMVLKREVSKKGKVTKLGEDTFNGKTRGDVLLRTFRSKLAPIPSVLTDLAVGKDYIGRKATLAREALNLAAPISTSGTIERVYRNIFEDEDRTVIEEFLNAMTDIMGVTSYED